MLWDMVWEQNSRSGAKWYIPMFEEIFLGFLSGTDQQFAIENCQFIVDFPV